MSVRRRTDKADLDVYLSLLGFLPEERFTGLPGQNRRFRWDWFHPERRVAVEYDGKGVGHQSIGGTWRDAEKTNLGQLAGILVIRCNAATVEDGRCQEYVDRAMAQREGEGAA